MGDWESGRVGEGESEGVRECGSAGVRDGWTPALRVILNGAKDSVVSLF